MATKIREDFHAKCPYYKGDKMTQISCLGVMGMVTSTYFVNKRAMQDHKDNFCNSCYKGCPLFAAIDEQEMIKLEEG